MANVEIKASEVKVGDYIQLRSGPCEVLAVEVKDDKAFIRVLRDKAPNTFKADADVTVIREDPKPVVVDKSEKADKTDAPAPTLPVFAPDASVAPHPVQSTASQSPAIPDTAPPKSPKSA